LRHPVAAAISTYEKSTGLPEDGKFKVRGNIEEWARRDNIFTGEDPEGIFRRDYFDVYLRYWEQYHYNLALTGFSASRNWSMVVYGRGKQIPILLACSGPQSLRQAGRIADAVLINVGFSPDMISDAMRWVREGAETAGRDPAAIEIWAFGIGAIADSREQALDEAIGPAVAIAAYVLRGNPATKRIPPAVAGKVGQLLREYQYGEHLVPGHTSNYHLASRLGITDYLLDRFAIAGTPEDCRGKIAALREAGVRNLCFSFSGGPDPARYVQRFGEEVLPAFAS